MALGMAAHPLNLRIVRCVWFPGAAFRSWATRRRVTEGPLFLDLLARRRQNGSVIRPESVKTVCVPTTQQSANGCMLAQPPTSVVSVSKPVLISCHTPYRPSVNTPSLHLPMIWPLQGALRGGALPYGGPFADRLI